MPWVDRMFGTLHLPKHWPPSYGIDEPVRDSMQHQLLDPLSAPRRNETAIRSRSDAT